jgi:hypothetical protein
MAGELESKLIAELESIFNGLARPTVEVQKKKIARRLDELTKMYKAGQETGADKETPEDS